MEEALNKFETMVGSAEKKLDNIEKKIDAEFSKHLNCEDDDDDDAENKLSLLKKLEEVKAEYSTLCKEAAEVSTAQRQMAEAFQQELLAQVKQLQMLQDRGFTGSDRRLDGDAEAAVNTFVQKSDGQDSSLMQSANETR
ncbi:uncharacterized protein LOC144420883 [Styela clava]